MSEEEPFSRTAGEATISGFGKRAPAPAREHAERSCTKQALELDLPRLQAQLPDLLRALLLSSSSGWGNSLNILRHNDPRMSAGLETSLGG